MGREAFVERVWEWVRQYKHRIQDQHRRLGASCDWERERFTLDDGLSDAVREVFVRLYEEGLVYRGERIINWCPKDMSSISDLEVDVEKTPGALYYVRYPLEPLDGERETRYITVATTRPETILGDTGVAVNPEDERYRDLVGRYAILPIMNRRIPIVADAAVDKEFGTGAVKMTPGARPDRLRDRQPARAGADSGHRLRREDDRGGGRVRRAGSLRGARGGGRGVAQTGPARQSGAI